METKEMIVYLLAVHIAISLAVAMLDIYVQLVLADNWPPTDYSKLAWEAVLMLIGLSLMAWPLVLFLLWLDNKHGKLKAHKRTQSYHDASQR